MIESIGLDQGITQQFSDQEETTLHPPSTPSPHSILWLTQLEIAVSLGDRY
jgi:hypothetical protein